MEIEEIRIQDLTLDDRNARKHGMRNLAAIVASLERFGQQKPIVIDHDNVVKAGNGTLAAAKELGWETVRCVRTGLEGKELAAFAVADNRSSDLAEWDQAVLIDQLREFEAIDAALFNSTGFNEGELLAMINADAPVTDPNEEYQGMPEFEQKTNAFRSLIVHFMDADSVVKFAETIGQELGEKTRFVWFPEMERADTTSTRVVSDAPA